MSVLWCGAEDIDFTLAGTPLPKTDVGSFRSGYARHSISVYSTGFAKSSLFPGGAVTSCWFSFQAYTRSGISRGTDRRIAGLTHSGFGSLTKGLWVTTSAATDWKLALAKDDGTTLTELAAEVGVSLLANILYKFDLHVTSYGASGTVDLYLDGNLVVTYTGDVTVSGIANLDQVIFYGWNSDGAGGFGNKYYNFSEFIVADEDTRTFSLLTMAPNGATTPEDWTGAYTDVNETTLNDATVVITNVNAKDEQFTLIDTPAGSFSCKAVMRSARACKVAGAVSKIALGIYSGSLDAGTAQNMDYVWLTYNRLMQVNPVTGNPFTEAELDALKSNLESAT